MAVLDASLLRRFEYLSLLARRSGDRSLAAGPQGLDDLQRLVCCAARHLAWNGWLLVEHGYDQGDHVRQLFGESGYRDISDHTDAAGISRVTMGRK